MNIYSGLEQHQAIKCGDTYIVQLGLGYGNAYEIDGVLSSGSKQVVVETLDGICRVYPEQQKLLGYLEKDNSTQVSTEEYTKLHAELHKFYDDVYEDYNFPTIEAEIDHVKLKAYVSSLQPVFETIPSHRELVEITVVGSVEDTGSDFIETPYVYGKASFGKSGIYRVNLSRIALDEFQKVCNEYSDVTFDLPTHSHLKYVKVDTHYVFTNRNEQWINNNNSIVVLNDLKEAHEKEREIRKFVRGMLETYAAPRKAGDVQIKDFVESLRGIKATVDALNVKQKSHHSYVGLRRRINELISKYTQE